MREGRRRALAALFSGGKDSTRAIDLARRQGHEVACLVSVVARSPESRLLHHPNMRWTRLQAEAMGIPQITAVSESDDTAEELRVLEGLLADARERFGIDGLVHGGIRSGFQKERFEGLCGRLGLAAVAPLWGADPDGHMYGLLDAGFTFVVTSVSAGGLDERWLGHAVSARRDIDALRGLSSRFGFNLDFEGGEAETFVTKCPLFSGSIRINRGDGRWDGYRGRFEIADAELVKGDA